MATKELYLDLSGVSKLWTKVKALVKATDDKIAPLDAKITTVDNKIVDASTTQRGLVNTSGQAFKGVKTFETGLSVTNSSASPIMYFLRSNSGTAPTADKMAAIFANSKKVNNKNVVDRLYFRHYSYNTSGDGIEVWDQYRFPSVDQGKTSQGTYEILTSKNVVTVAQGGTGATTAQAARTNLGIDGGTQLYSGTLSSGNAVLTNGKNYVAIVIQAVVGAQGSATIQVFAIIPTTHITTTSIPVNLNDEVYYASVNIYKSSNTSTPNDIYIQYKNASNTSCRVQKVYGIN